MGKYQLEDTDAVFDDLIIWSDLAKRVENAEHIQYLHVCVVGIALRSMVFYGRPFHVRVFRDLTTVGAGQPVKRITLRWPLRAILSF